MKIVKSTKKLDIKSNISDKEAEEAFKVILKWMTRILIEKVF